MRLFPRVLLIGSLLGPLYLGARPAPLRAVTPLPAYQVADTVFRHDLHRDFACLDCHAMRADHGALLVAEVSDCRSCHHVRERDRGCAACHETEELSGVVLPVDRAFRFSVLDRPVERRIDFSHEAHETRECGDCHTGAGPDLEASELDCESCHDEHHGTAVSGCMECHRDPGEDVHPLDVHETCSGSGCHTDPPFTAPPPTRVGCLWCHQDMTDHEPQGECVDCHFPVGGRQPARTVPFAPTRLPEDFSHPYVALHPCRTHEDLRRCRSAAIW